METDFIPLDYDYFDFEGRNYIRIIGRNSKGKRICVVDTCDIYLWAILKENVKKEKISKLIEKIEKINLDSKGRQTKVEKVELREKNFLGKKVKALKVFATNYKDLHDIADELGFDEIEKRRGYDLGFTTHYIIEKKIVPCNWYEISGDLVAGNDFAGIGNIDVDFCLKLNKSRKIEDKKFEPKIVAYDIETDDIKIGKGEILMISLVSDNFKKVITWKKTKKKFDYVEHVKDESELLEKFSEHLKKLSPDFLVGYYSDNFDLPYLKARAEENKVRLSLGLDGSEPKFSRGIELTGKIKGIVHIDLLRFIRTAYSQYMQSETMRLDDVATEFLGEGKKVFKFKHSSKIKEDEWESFFEYNLHDSVLVFKLFEKMWPDILEFSRIIQEPVFEASRNGMSKNVESY
ncbi:MAG: 3'-5' exonuclease, partial [Nanoarchaeota archaeon]